MYGWECPKCNRVWGPQESGCQPCNIKAAGGHHLVGPVQCPEAYEERNLTGKPATERELARLGLSFPYDHTSGEP